MSDNLEDFLRQAAQRRQQRAAGQKPASEQQRAPVRRVERSRQVVEAEIIDSEDSGESVSRRVISPSPVTQPHVVPTLTPTVSPSKEIDSADERMAKHVQDWLVHPVSNLASQTASAASAISAEVIPVQETAGIKSSTNTQVRKEFKHPLVDMLRRPDTLRAAFIVGEILKTKF